MTTYYATETKVLGYVKGSGFRTIHAFETEASRDAFVSRCVKRIKKDENAIIEREVVSESTAKEYLEASGRSALIKHSTLRTKE